MRTNKQPKLSVGWSNSLQSENLNFSRHISYSIFSKNRSSYRKPVACDVPFFRLGLQSYKLFCYLQHLFSIFFPHLPEKTPITLAMGRQMQSSFSYLENRNSFNFCLSHKTMILNEKYFEKPESIYLTYLLSIQAKAHISPKQPNFLLQLVQSFFETSQKVDNLFDLGV